MVIKKITYNELITLLKLKKCVTPLNTYLAEHLFKNKDHPIATIDSDDFRVSRDLFPYLLIEYEHNDKSRQDKDRESENTCN